MKTSGSLREKIYQNIRDEITYGKLSPGEQIFEEAIAKRFNVSRTPLREAIRQLQMERYINVIPNVGAFVSKTTISDIENIYDLITLLEVYALELVIPQITKDGVKELQVLHEKICQAAQNRNVRNYYENNTKFHLFFVKNCGNNRLEDMVVMLRNQVYRTHYIGITIPGHSDEYIGDHEKILQAVLDKDVTKGQINMERHLRRTRDILVNHLKNNEYFSV